MSRAWIALPLAAILAACADPGRGAAGVHAAALTLDSHVDIDFEFASASIDPLTADIQVSLEKMRSGGLDAAFFIVYVGQTERTPENYLRAQADALTKFAAIRRMTDELYPQHIGLAQRAGDVERLIGDGRLAAAIGIENGYVIGTDLGLLERYHALGARYMTLVHNGHNDIADSATPRARLGDEPAEHDGVSAFGARVIERMNALGMIVDISHASKQAALEAIDLSAAPVIASHSSVRALADHPRNLDDETLLRLRDSGGVVQIVAYPGFLVAAADAGDELPTADVVAFADHIDYAAELIGIDHVGISSDFGGGGGIVGWADASATPNVTAELLRRGYSYEAIEKIWSGNLLRVWREVEAIAARR